MLMQFQFLISFDSFFFLAVFLAIIVVFVNHIAIYLYIYYYFLLLGPHIEDMMGL